jgi:hypothetical protein
MVSYHAHDEEHLIQQSLHNAGVCITKLPTSSDAYYSKTCLKLKPVSNRNRLYRKMCLIPRIQYETSNKPKLLTAETEGKTRM